MRETNTGYKLDEVGDVKQFGLTLMDKMDFLGDAKSLARNDSFTDVEDKASAIASAFPHEVRRTRDQPKRMVSF